MGNSLLYVRSINHIYIGKEYSLQMKTYQELQKLLDREITANKEEFVKLNDYMALHPEPSGEEYETSKMLVNFLRSKGYTVEAPFCGFDCAFHAVYGENDHTHKAAVFCEYDALPEVGHACGHCLSGSISLLAALSLIPLQDELDCDIHIFGSPREEIGGSKMNFAEEGYFDGFELATMVHLYNKNIIAPQLIALDSYMYHFHGKVAHAAVNPWDGINALNALQLMFHGMDMMRQHVKPDVRIHAVIKDGGTAANIVPDETSAEVYVRAPKWADVVEVVKKVDGCAQAGCCATGATWDKERTAEPYYEVKPNPTGHKVLEDIYEELGLETVDDLAEVFGSTDAGNVSYVCPTFHPCLQVVDEDILIHTKAFAAAMTSQRAHRTLEIGAKIIGYQVARTFSDEKILAQMMQDFKNEK